MTASKKYIYFLTSLVQVALLLGVAILEKLSKEKAGVAHHLIFRKFQYQAGLMSEGKLVIFAGFLLLLAYLILSRKKTYGFLRLEYGLLTLLSIFFIVTGQVARFNAFVYLVLGLGLIHLLEIIKIYVIAKNEY